MLYTTLLAATAAFSGLVAAQNSSSSLPLPNGISQCCTVNPNDVPEGRRTAWCTAQENTCPEICGGQGQIANNGNECDEDNLRFTCKCRNGTEPVMSDYEQSVPGQMCRFWFEQCTNKTIDPSNNEGSATLQFSCDTIRNQECGNKTTRDASTTASTSSRTSRPTSTSSGSGSGDATSSAGSASGTPGAAIRLAQDFAAPVLAGGMIALFGIAL